MIYVTPLLKLPDVVRKSGASYLVSLMTAGAEFERPLEISKAHHLHLTMHDIVEPRPGMTLASEDHVRGLIDFALAWNRSQPMVINCYAGISRSTAAAYVIACALNPDCSEAYLADELRRLSPSATPNSRIVALADEILARNGRMERAIEKIGRGEDAFEGAPFAIAI